MASEVRAGLPSAQRKAKESQDAIDRSQQRIDELDTQIEAVKERMNGIDGGSLQQLGQGLQNAHARTPTRRADNGTPSPNGFERVEGRLPADEQTWNAKRAALALSLDTYDKRLEDARSEYQRMVVERHARQGERDLLRQDYRRKIEHRTRISDDMEPCAHAHRTGDRAWTRRNCRTWPN